MTHKNSIDSDELLYLLENIALAQLAHGQPQEFWQEIDAKIDASAVGGITFDEFIQTLRKVDE